jgi:pimeloyl-ACP methyl ester carboxylesterase
VERLCQEFRIVTVDPRGTGNSDPLVRPYALTEHVKDFRAVIAALGGGPVVGVGISQGANLLFRLVHDDPHLLKKLVTIGGPPCGPAPPFFSEEHIRRQRELFEKGEIEAIIRLHTSLVFSEPGTRELKELFIRNRLQLPSETILSFFDSDSTRDVTAILPEITLPTLVTHGREDRIVASSAAKYIAERLPHAEVYLFEGKGHVPLFTATDEFCKVLRSFVRTGTIADTNTTEVTRSARMHQPRPPLA